jgi:hypothetical protein
MTHGQDPKSTAHPADTTILWCKLYRAERAYDRALTTLWVGNAGGALTTLAYATANRHDGTFTRSLLVPLVLFVIGLVVTGVSSLIEFETGRRATMRTGGELPLGWRTATALASGACFVIAFMFGFVMLARN